MSCVLFFFTFFSFYVLQCWRQYCASSTGNFLFYSFHKQEHIFIFFLHWQYYFVPRKFTFKCFIYLFIFCWLLTYVNFVTRKIHHHVFKLCICHHSLPIITLFYNFYFILLFNTQQESFVVIIISICWFFFCFCFKPHNYCNRV